MKKKNTKNKNLKNKNKLIMIFIAIIIIVIIVFSIIKLSSGKEPDGEIDKPISSLPEVLDFNLKQDDYVIEGNVEATEFRIYYSEKSKKWSIDVKIENNSSKEVDLQDYGINVYDKSNHLLCKISKGVAGKIGAKEALYVIVGTQDDLRTADHIDIMKK